MGGPTENVPGQPGRTGRGGTSGTNILLLTSEFRVFDTDDSAAATRARVPDAITEPAEISAQAGAAAEDRTGQGPDAPPDDALAAAYRFGHGVFDRAAGGGAAAGGLAEGPAAFFGAGKTANAAPGQQDAGSQALDAKIKALETAIGKSAEVWEPDEPGADDYSGTAAPALAWEDEVSAPRGKCETPPLILTEEARNAGRDTPVPQSSDSPHALVAEPPEIDEDMLRDIVTDMLRKELQGATGDRISHNLRKLVRREVQRALAAQDPG